MNLRRLPLKLMQQPGIGRVAALPYRVYWSWRHVADPFQKWVRWLLRSREITNWTYALTPQNLDYLASFCSVVTGRPKDEIDGYIQELLTDRDLVAHVASVQASAPARRLADSEIHFGRRIGWYVFVRALRPRVVIETGLDKGLGAVVLCSALLRNGTGHYYGFELHPEQGYLLSGPYAKVGTIINGDAITNLREFKHPVDLYVNDSDHTPGYEAAELEVVGGMLSESGVILGDNADYSDELFKFANRTGRQFLFFKEEPVNHWYPGAGIGVAFRQRDAREAAKAAR
jgi:hypothetical protein